MVKVNQPARGGMTDVARFDSGDMIRAFTASDYSIMTAFTGTNGLRMVGSAGRQWCPGLWRHAMTRLAGVRGVNVVRSFAAGNGTVMTTDAGANDLCMIHVGRRNRYPGCGSG